MKKVKIKKKYFDTFKWTSGEYETTFFCANSKSKIVAGVDVAYASKDKIDVSGPTLKKKLFFISALKSPTYRDFMP